MRRKRQDNITALLDLLDTRDFYSRLYSLQLMFQISSARPERTQECILTAPLGIPRLVGALGDSREPIRNGKLHRVWIFYNARVTHRTCAFYRSITFTHCIDTCLGGISETRCLRKCL